MDEIPPLGRTLLGGLLGTLAQTAALYGLAPVLLGRPLDGAALLARLLDVPWETGLLMTFVNGAILLPAVYAVLVSPWLPAPPWLRGAFFGAALWLAGELVVAPLAGTGLFHADAGGTPAAAGALAGRLLYGMVLATIADRVEGVPRRDAEMASGRRGAPHAQRG